MVNPDRIAEILASYGSGSDLLSMATTPSLTPPFAPTKIDSQGMLIGDDLVVVRVLDGHRTNARVFFCHDDRSEAAVVAKCARSAEQQIGLHREYVIGQKLNSSISPHIVHTRELRSTRSHGDVLLTDFVGMIDNRGVLASRTLTHELVSGRMTPRLAIQLILQVGTGTEVMHQNGIIHRDLKCDNICLSESGGSDRFNARIVDLGLARDQRPSYLTHHQDTPVSTQLGTFGHTDPLVLSGARATLASDVYALGNILFRMLSGVAPGRFPSVGALPVGNQLRDVIADSLSTDISCRPRDATEFLVEIIRCPECTSLVPSKATRHEVRQFTQDDFNDLEVT